MVYNDYSPDASVKIKQCIIDLRAQVETGKLAFGNPILVLTNHPNADDEPRLGL
jgi:hypothetical protein